MPTGTRGRDPAVEEEFLGALYKGGELLASGKIVEAREHLERAHDLEPKNEKAQNLLGLAYFKLGLFDRASEVYERLVNENPTDATLRVNLGLVYLKTNNLERSIKEFETATDLEPTHKKAHNYLGLALAQQGTYAKAKEHFELAGSDQMAEKMSRAIAAQSSPSGLHLAVPRQPPKTVVLGDAEEPPKPPPPVAAAIEEEEAIEVMSDEELPSDVYVVPDEEVLPSPPVAAVPPPPPAAALETDWGAQLGPASDAGEMRFAEDEGPGEAAILEANPPPVEELPVLEAEVVPAPSAPPATTPAWLTMEAAEAQRTPPPPSNDSGWVTEGVAEVPLPEQGPTWTETPLPTVADDASWAAQPANTETVVAESWGQPPVDDSSWNTPRTIEPLPAPSWTAPVEAPAAPPDDASWAAAPAPAEDASWGAAAAVTEPVPATPDDASWATAPAEDASWTSAAAVTEPVPATPDDASWATAPAVEPLPTTPDDASWATGVEPASAPAAEPLPTTPDDASWATGVEPASEPLPATADDASWATAAPAAEPLPAPPDDASWATGAAATNETADAIPAPEPSAPLPITVEEPVESSPAPAAAPPAGYTPMSPQRLVDLGASGSWVQEPTAGPFHVSSDGLAVTVAGEMLMRMGGLVAVVGSLNVAPENRRRRGRPTAEPFGSGPNQLQRVSGNGMVYLEPGRAKFHAVDLTDQNGVSIDDDGAYLREELVFAFEEPISFENGKLTADGQSLELAHLKGTGRVLLQLDGSLKAMPIPLGAPLVVPLQRVVGWFGRVTPRLMGFGGRGAIELTGEGYALLGTPAERT
ncbi:MAG: tetratricopeptide repeat protein [Myxococcota bacterium]